MFMMKTTIDQYSRKQIVKKKKVQQNVIKFNQINTTNCFSLLIYFHKKRHSSILKSKSKNIANCFAFSFHAFFLFLSSTKAPSLPMACFFCAYWGAIPTPSQAAGYALISTHPNTVTMNQPSNASGLALCCTLLPLKKKCCNYPCFPSTWIGWCPKDCECLWGLKSFLVSILFRSIVSAKNSPIK